AVRPGRGSSPSGTVLRSATVIRPTVSERTVRVRTTPPIPGAAATKVPRAALALLFAVLVACATGCGTTEESPRGTASPRSEPDNGSAVATPEAAGNPSAPAAIEVTVGPGDTLGAVLGPHLPEGESLLAFVAAVAAFNGIDDLDRIPP